MFESVVETIDFPNKGILHMDGERVIVKNAIPCLLYTSDAADE